MIQLMLQTGIKLSELINLTIQDVELPSDLSNEAKKIGFLRILGSKSKKGRLIPLNSKVCISLANYINSRKTASNPSLFINRDGGTLGARGVEKAIQKYMLQIGITDASVQSLRHTFGIHHLISGATRKMIKEVMGYRDSRSVSIYDSMVKNGMINELQKHAL